MFQNPASQQTLNCHLLIGRQVFNGSNHALIPQYYDGFHSYCRPFPYAGQSALAVTPRNLFDDNSFAAGAIDAPHSVEQEHKISPDRNELETPFGEPIISGRGLMTAGTARLRTHAGTYLDFDTLAVGTEAGPAINESGKMVATI